jgi:hypothetical protein
MFYLSEIKNGVVKAAYKSIDGIPVNGFTVTPIPSVVSIDAKDTQHNPPRLYRQDVVRQKYQGILNNNPYFSHVTFDSLEDSSGIDTTSLIGGTGGFRHWLRPQVGGQPGELSTLPRDVSGDGTFSSFRVHWDLYRLVHTSEGSFNVVYYEEVDPDSVSVTLSHDGVTETAVSFMTQAVVGAPGSLLSLKFQNTSSERYYLGGWAILY